MTKHTRTTETRQSLILTLAMQFPVEIATMHRCEDDRQKADRESDEWYRHDRGWHAAFNRLTALGDAAMKLPAKTPAEAAVLIMLALSRVDSLDSEHEEDRKSALTALETALPVIFKHAGLDPATVAGEFFAGIAFEDYPT
ncbi:MAG TPA: hypothetical protein VF194_18655 [Ferrovibrio sp.]|uniref:hypothetical protein n=1 Tax=Ferrovibrio sp. TaxID=1917215 RepID=UPI002ED636D3